MKGLFDRCLFGFYRSSSIWAQNKLENIEDWGVSICKTMACLTKGLRLWKIYNIYAQIYDTNRRIKEMQVTNIKKGRLILHSCWELTLCCVLYKILEDKNLGWHVWLQNIQSLWIFRRGLAVQVIPDLTEQSMNTRKLHGKNILMHSKNILEMEYPKCFQRIT